MGAQPCHYAILIGINAYDPEHAPLRGCVRDVDEISKKLEQSIPDVCIERFTASARSSEGLAGLVEPEEQWPTYTNIVSSLRRTIDKSRPGDHVYIHYSGHGTIDLTSEDQGNSDEKSLALVLLEGATASDIRYLHSKELAERMHELVKRGLSVTVSLDCCFSGSTFRNDDAARYVPYRPEVDQKYPLLGDQGTGGDTKAIEPGAQVTRQASLSKNWLLDLKDYAILVSSDATELAYEVKFDKSGGKRHGALSFFLIDSFHVLGGVGGSMGELLETIKVRVQNYRNGSRKTQSPILFGNKMQPFFGCHKVGRSGDIPITKVVGTNPPELRLHAGEAHGISEKDQFALHAIGSKTSTSSGSEIVAKVVSVRGITSDLELIKGDIAVIETGWLATAMTRFALQKFPVQFNVSEAQRKNLQTAIQRRESLKESQQGDGSPSFIVTQLHDDTYEIRDEQDRVVSRITGSKGAERAKEKLMNQIHHLVSFRLVRDLVNPAADLDTLGFRRLFDVQITKTNSEDNEQFNTGCLQTGDIYGTCSHPECVLTMTTSDRLNICVNNIAADTNQKLYLSIYIMSSNWEIENALGATHEVILPSGGGLDGDATGIWKKKMAFSLEDEQEECEDVVKVFLTAQPTSFTALALPKLGDFGREEPEFGFKADDQKLEDWAVLTFRVRTIE